MDKKQKTQLGKIQSPQVEKSTTKPKLQRKKYEEQIAKLHAELVKLQFWVKHTGAKIVVVFEGRDAAGKGGVIKRITERVSPRVFRVVALPAPSERERTQIYFQRYFEHLPAGGEIIIFDRSWYNRLGVERVMGFCTDEEYERFLVVCPAWEKDIINAGIGKGVGQHQDYKFIDLPGGTVNTPGTDDFVEVSFAAVGDRLTLTIGGRKAAEARDSTHARGWVDINTSGCQAEVKDIEVKILRR